MRRREFILLSGPAAVWPLFARAQQTSLPVVGFLNSASADGYASMAAAFKRGLKEAGYAEGQNVTIEYRWGIFQFDRLKALAAELVRHPVAVIVAAGFGPPVVAAKEATSTIPIVFTYGADPVRAGFVASLNRPGGNVTGATAISEALLGKRLNLLRDLVPQATTLAFLSRPNLLEKNPLLAEARYLNRQLIILEIRTDRDYGAAPGRSTEESW